jgi:hypothetical protein
LGREKNDVSKNNAGRRMNEKTGTVEEGTGSVANAEICSQYCGE